MDFDSGQLALCFDAPIAVDAEPLPARKAFGSQDITGKQFAHWTVASQAGQRVGLGHDKRTVTLWNCVCRCGNVGVHSKRALTSGNTVSCGCVKRETRKRWDYEEARERREAAAEAAAAEEASRGPEVVRLPIVNRAYDYQGCTGAERPCPTTSCAMHLFEHRPKDFGHAEETRPTCALDAASDGGRSHAGCGELLGLTRQRVEQIEKEAFMKLREAFGDELLEMLKGFA